MKTTMIHIYQYRGFQKSRASLAVVSVTMIFRNYVGFEVMVMLLSFLQLSQASFLYFEHMSTQNLDFSLLYK
jgi:hypothetical protein